MNHVEHCPLLVVTGPWSRFNKTAKTGFDQISAGILFNLSVLIKFATYNQQLT